MRAKTEYAAPACVIGGFLTERLRGHAAASMGAVWVKGTRLHMRWVFTFQEIVATAGGCEAAYRAGGIDLRRPYRVMAGAVFIVVD